MKLAYGCRDPAECGSIAPAEKSKRASGGLRKRRPFFARRPRHEVGCWAPLRKKAPMIAAHSPAWKHRSSSREGGGRTCKLSGGWGGRKDWPDWDSDLSADERGQSQPRERPSVGVTDAHLDANWHKWANPYTARGLSAPGGVEMTGLFILDLSDLIRPSTAAAWGDGTWHNRLPQRIKTADVCKATQWLACSLLQGWG